MAHSTTRNKNAWRRREAQKGAALVELAVCLPVIILIVFGAIESASMIFLKQTLVQTAYESIKVAAKNGATNAQANAAGQQVLAGRNLDGVQIRFEPSDIESVNRGALLRVFVDAPTGSNSPISFGFFSGRRIRVQAAMLKE